MKYIVAVRDQYTTVQFSFETEAEREEFITKTKEFRPSAEFVRSEVNSEALFYPFNISA